MRTVRVGEAKVVLDLGLEVGDAAAAFPIAIAGGLGPVRTANFACGRIVASLSRGHHGSHGAQ